MHSVRPSHFSSWGMEGDSPALHLCPVPRMTSPVFPTLDDDPDLGLTPEKPPSAHKIQHKKDSRPKARQKVRFADNVDMCEKVSSIFECNIGVSNKKPAEGVNDSVEIINIETENISLNDSHLSEDQPRTVRYEHSENINRYTKMIESGQSLPSCLFANLGDNKQSEILESGNENSTKSVLPPVEHALARPEFNSTLWMNKELQQLKSQTLNITAAVEEKLKVSHSTRQKIAEKTFRQLNHPAVQQQFPELVSLEVPEDEIVSMAVKEQSSKVRPIRKEKSKPQQVPGSNFPDILDFLTPDLQREAASFHLDGLHTQHDAFVMAPPESAFDIYKHIRVWENH